MHGAQQRLYQLLYGLSGPVPHQPDGVVRVMRHLGRILPGTTLDEKTYLQHLQDATTLDEAAAGEGGEIDTLRLGENLRVMRYYLTRPVNLLGASILAEGITGQDIAGELAAVYLNQTHGYAHEMLYELSTRPSDYIRPPAWLQVLHTYSQAGRTPSRVLTEMLLSGEISPPDLPGVARDILQADLDAQGEEILCRLLLDKAEFLPALHAAQHLSRAS